MKRFAFIVKPFLNVVAWFLKLSRHNIYYLVNGPLHEEIKEAYQKVYSHQHIETAIVLAKQYSVNPEAVILDAGGGTGTTAKMFSDRFPGKTIYIFEPIESNQEIIQKQVGQYKNWTLIPKAVGAAPAKTVIHIANRITSSSLLDLNPGMSGDYLSDALIEKGVQEIIITTLDNEIPISTFVDILKIDVQGFELEVLKGGELTLKRTLVILLEISTHDGYKGAPKYYDIDEYLRTRQFELFDLTPSLRENNKLLEWDAIYVNRVLAGLNENSK